MSRIEEWVKMYSLCAHSSYGRICASYFCIVCSVWIWQVAETLPLRKHVTFSSPSFDFHLMLVDILLHKDHEGFCDTVEEQKKWEIKGDEVSLLCIIHGNDFFSMCVIYEQIQRTRRDWRFCSGHVFFPYYHFFQSVCFVHLCIYVSDVKMTYVCLIASRKVVLNHQTADKTLMLAVTTLG